MVFPTVTKTNTKIGLAITLTLAVIVSIGILIAPSFFPMSEKGYVIPQNDPKCITLSKGTLPSQIGAVLGTLGACYKGNPPTDCFQTIFSDFTFADCQGKLYLAPDTYTFCKDSSCQSGTTTVKPTIVVKSPSSGVNVALGSSVYLVSEVRNDPTGKYGSIEWFDASGLLKYGSSIAYTFTTPGTKSVYAVGGTNDDYIVSPKIIINVTNPTGSKPGCCSYQRSDSPFRALNVYESVCLSQYTQGKWTPTCDWYRCKSAGGYESCSPYNAESCNLMHEQVASCSAGTGQSDGYFKCNFTDKTCTSCIAGTTGCVAANNCDSACQTSYPTFTCSGSPNYTCNKTVCTLGTPGCYAWLNDCSGVCNVPTLNWCVAGSTGGKCVASITKPAGTVLKIFPTASECSWNCPTAVTQATGCCSIVNGFGTAVSHYDNVTKAVCDTKPIKWRLQKAVFCSGAQCNADNKCGAVVNQPVDLCLNVTGTQPVIPVGTIQDSSARCYCNPTQPGSCPDTSIPDLTLKTSIAGKVSRNNEGDFQTSDTNLAISGARVSFFDLTDKKEYGPVLSLSDGKYQISNVPISTFGVHVKADGYVQYCGKVSSPDTMADFELYPLKMPTTISGGTFNGIGNGGRPTATPQLASSLQCLYNKLNNNVEFEGYELRYTSLGRYGTNVACHGKTVGGVTADYAADIQVFKDGVNKLKIGDKAESNKLCKLVEETAKTCKFTSLLDERNNATPLGCQDYSATGEAVHLHLSVCNCDDKDYNGNVPLSCTADNSITNYTCSF